MSEPQGTLTPTQLEIMEVVWSGSDRGVSGSEIWQAVSLQRKVVRTTVLNQVDRLEKRGWLTRNNDESGVRFCAVISREPTENLLARQFVDDFFKGSVPNLVSRLFGGGAVSEEDIRKMEAIIKELPRSTAPKQKRQTKEVE